MNKEIIFEIEEETGKIDAKTEGFTGKSCIDELDSLLDEIAMIEEHVKTDDYYKEETIRSNINLKQKLRKEGRN